MNIEILAKRTGQLVAVELDPTYRYKRTALITQEDIPDALEGQFDNDPELTLELNLGDDDNFDITA